MTYAQDSAPLLAPEAGTVAVGSRPITVILNAGSGSDEKASVEDQIVDELKSLGRSVTMVRISPADRFHDVCERTVVAVKNTGGLVVAAGGDGTVNAVAACCCKHGVAMGVIPLGTFNYFSREFEIPQEPAAAAAHIADGVVRKVTVGYVNDHLFLNNASFGLYTHVIRSREEDKSRFGRFRMVAALSAVATLFRGQRPFAIRILAGEVQAVLRTTMVFVGNNATQLDNLDLDIAQCAREDRLAVVLLKPLTRLASALLLVRGIFKMLNDDTRLEMFCIGEFDVESRRKYVDVVVDGELVRCKTPLSFRTAPGALSVVVPRTVEQ